MVRLLVTVAVVVAVVGVLAAIVLGSGMLRSLPAMLGQRGAHAAGVTVVQPSAVPVAVPDPNSGVDVSFPQCQVELPSEGVGFAIVGLTGGRPAKDQPCLSEQWAWAQGLNAAAVYVNTEFIAGTPDAGDPAALGRADAFDGLNRIAAAGNRGQYQGRFVLPFRDLPVHRPHQGQAQQGDQIGQMPQHGNQGCNTRVASMPSMGGLALFTWSTASSPSRASQREKSPATATLTRIPSPRASRGQASRTMACRAR